MSESHPPTENGGEAATLVARNSDRRLELPPFQLRSLRVIDCKWGEGWELRPSPRRRHWMDELPYSYNCLPLVVANQWGWQILCPTDLEVTWDGSMDRFGLWVRVDPQYAPAIKSHFGQGIVTFSPPWLFRTPPGWDIYVKGPGNRWKPNCAPLEGIVETWWLNYTFTMNWKLIEPGTVAFAKGESIAQLVPVPHQTFVDSTAEEVPVDEEPEIARELLDWMEQRRRIRHDSVNTHKLYRKAEKIDDHLVTVSVPPVESRPAQPRPSREEGESSQ